MSELRVTKNPSRNKKLVGDLDIPFFATYRAVGYSCPKTCPLLNDGCYAQSGNVALHQRGMVSEDDGTVYLRELARIPEGAIMRLHVSGDVMTNEGGNGSDTVDVPYLNALIEGARQRPDVTFYGYTHAWRKVQDIVSPTDFPSNFALNASVDDPDELDEARAAGWATTVVVPHDTPKRVDDVVVCPAQTTDGMSCATCKMCFKNDRKLTVGFRAHGSGKRKVSERLNREGIALPVA